MKKLEAELQLRRALAEEPDLFDERNFASLVAAGAPNDDEAADALLPCDVEPRRAPSPTARFWAKVEATESGCWIWTAQQLRGYGQFHHLGGRKVIAHRFAYEELIGPIPEGLTIDHLCRIPSCVNPLHMEPVTNRINVLRSENPAARAARQTALHQRPRLRPHEHTDQQAQAALSRLRQRTRSRSSQPATDARSRCAGRDRGKGVSKRLAFSAAVMSSSADSRERIGTGNDHADHDRWLAHLPIVCVPRGLAYDRTPHPAAGRARALSVLLDGDAAHRSLAIKSTTRELPGGRAILTASTGARASTPAAERPPAGMGWEI